MNIDDINVANHYLGMSNYDLNVNIYAKKASNIFIFGA